MTESLRSFLDSIDADADTIQQAARYYLAERTDDLPPEDMRVELLTATDDTAEAERLLQALTIDSRALEQGALVVLSAAWEEPGQAELVRNALLDAKRKLPVIEASILGIVVMYGMYLSVTRGKKREQRIVERTPGGGFKETTEVDYYSASGPLSAITRLFSAQPPQ